MVFSDANALASLLSTIFGANVGLWYPLFDKMSSESQSNVVNFFEQLQHITAHCRRHMHATFDATTVEIAA